MYMERPFAGKELLEEAQALAPEIISWYRTLHRMPETGWILPETAAFVRQELEKMGIACDAPYAEHSSVTAVIPGAGQGEGVALRADMDALNVREETGLSYAAENGNMHACGHDAHTAMLLGAAKLLSRRAGRLPGPVRLIFQAGEELSGVAERLVQDGVLETPHVGAVFGQHVGTLVGPLAVGTVAVKPGCAMAAKVRFAITVHGCGCHSGTPTQGVDPIAIAAQIITALQTLVSRECDAKEQAVLSVTSIHGGTADNIIPDTVELVGSLRAAGDTLSARLSERIEAVAKGIAQAMRGDCTVRWELICPALQNDEAQTELVRTLAEELFGDTRVHTAGAPSMASEDMACYLRERPGSFWFFGTQPETCPEGNHSPRFTVAESCLADGAALLAATAEAWLCGAACKK